MRILLALALPLALLAQAPAIEKEAKTKKPAPAKHRPAQLRLKKVRTSARLAAQAPAAEAKPQEAASKQEAAAESTSPKTEKALNGYIDLGARWVGRAGDFNTYRSVVNLSQGMRLVGTDLSYEPATSKLFDSLRLQMFNWGGDPYNTAKLDVVKKGAYRYTGAYSNIAYFNALPSFADPTMAKGVYLNQRSMDTRIRNYDNDLQLLPGGRIVPYLGFARNSSYGTGITPLVLSGNEYPLRNVAGWSQDEIRGGLRLEFNRWHATVEQGGRRFEDNQSVYSTEALGGNRSTSYLGQWLMLTSGNQLYRIRGNGDYTKALLTASPSNWLDLSGSFIRSRPKTYSELNQTEMGKLLSPDNPLQFLVGSTDYFFGNATMPHVSGSLSAEARVASRVRLRESWETDRYHTDGIGTLRSALLYTPATSSALTLNGGERLEVSHHRQQIEALVDILKNFTVRGGYRYEWGQSVMKASTYSVAGPQDRAELKRKAALAGFLIRPVQRLSLTGDIEITDGEKTYYRTGLLDTRRYRFQGRVTLPKNFFFNANYSYFENKNPNAGINYDYSSQAAAASLQWMPQGGKNISVIADYQRSLIKSDINYLYPLGLFDVRSYYQDYAHTGTLMADLRLPFSKGYSGRLTFGGSFVTTGGTRPADYYQPQGRLHLPVTPKLEFFSEWRYYGMSQAIYHYEGFRAHTFTGGVRLLM